MKDILSRILDDAGGWLQEMREETGWNDTEKIYRVITVVLQALRNQLPIEKAILFGDKLDFFWKGFYFEGWMPRDFSREEKGLVPLFREVESRLGPDAGEGAERLVKAVFKTLAHRTADEDLNRIGALLPPDIGQVWNEAVLRDWVCG